MLPSLAVILLGGFDVDALLWRDAVRAAGANVSSGQLQRVSNLIRGLKADGIWPLLDRLWIYASENATQARRDLVARVVATPQNSPPFTANRGYRGDGISALVDTGFNPTGVSGNYARNSAHYSLWIETADSSPGSTISMGGDLSYELRNGATNYAATVNSATATDSGVTVGSTGHFVMTRPAASGAGSQNIYRNGALAAADNQTSTAITNQNILMLTGNHAGSVTGYSDIRGAALSIGGSLSAAQEAAFYTRMRTYMTAVGVA